MYFQPPYGASGAYPPKQGMYNPAFEKDACGLAMVATLRGEAGHDIIALALAPTLLHWPALLRGERISLPFLVPGRQRYFPVQVRRIGPVRWQGIDGQSIDVSLDTWYGGIAPRLSLVYASTDRRLLEFRGTSNLRDARGTYPQVTVRFSSPAAEQTAGMAAGLDASSGRPLRRDAQVKSRFFASQRIHCTRCCVQVDTTPAEIPQWPL